MKQLCTGSQKRSIFVFLSFFALVIFMGSAIAGDNMMQKDLNDLSDLTSRWSKQLSSGKLTPEAQEKLAELLARTSQVLKDMSGKSVNKMQMDYNNKIDQMKMEWKPFDTSDRM